QPIPGDHAAGNPPGFAAETGAALPVRLPLLPVGGPSRTANGVVLGRVANTMPTPKAGPAGRTLGALLGKVPRRDLGPEYLRGIGTNGRGDGQGQGGGR